MIFKPNLMLIDALLQDAGSHTSNASTIKQPQQDMVQEEGFALRHKYTVCKKSVPYTIFLPNNHLRQAYSIYSIATKIYAGIWILR